MERESLAPISRASPLDVDMLETEEILGLLRADERSADPSDPSNPVVRGPVKQTPFSGRETNTRSDIRKNMDSGAKSKAPARGVLSPARAEMARALKKVQFRDQPTSVPTK